MSEDAAVMESEDVVDSVDTSSSETSDTSASTQAEATSPAAAAAPAASPQRSVWDAFKALPDFKDADDTTIARRLYASMEREKAATARLAQYQQYLPYAQQYLQNREPFEQWLASQRGQQQAAPQQPASAAEAVKRWWSPPEVKDSDKQYLMRDENGREVIAENTPLHVRERLYEYQKYKAEFAQKFLTNPEEALGPMVEDIAMRKAQELVQTQFAAANEQQFISQLEKENADWLYQEDGKTPTEEGQMIQQYIDRAAKMGIQGAQARWDYAQSMVELDLHNKLQTMRAQNSQRDAFEAGLPQQNAPAVQATAAPDASSQAQRDIEFLRREASRNPSRAAGSSDPRTPQAPLTFEQRLAKQLGPAGIS
jgi:hypothetical protein